MSKQLNSILKTDSTSFPYIVEDNVDIPLRTFREGLVRANVYRPHESGPEKRCPVLLTYGPYGKDAPYTKFRKESFDKVHPDHQSVHSAWEVPDPQWWTSHGYAVVRADEEGSGQSPGHLNLFGDRLSEAYHDVVEWAASQPWSNGKVGLMGVSYYGASQWFVAARRPKGLAALIIWEGFSDMYRDLVRHGGILSNGFFAWWWRIQVLPNQYGGKRAENSPFPPSVDGYLNEKELKANIMEPSEDLPNNPYSDDNFWKGRDVDLANIEVPLLSVANWGASLLHLRGNVEGYAYAGSKIKYLRFVTGRHDLPFYYPKSVELQKSFLDAFLNGKDRLGWSVPGRVAPVSVALRQSSSNFVPEEQEEKGQRRDEKAWPLPTTEYQKYFLCDDYTMSSDRETKSHGPGKLHWKALDESPDGRISFTTPPFSTVAEFTGHVTAHLNVGLEQDTSLDNTAHDIDIFLTIRHLDSDDKEICYTGPMGEPMAVTKGWLRVSLRKTDLSHPHHRHYLPYRHYRSFDVEEVKPGDIYEVDIEIWPTNVIIQPGQKLLLEISGADTEGINIFTHNSPLDRPQSKFGGRNILKFGIGQDNYLTLPYIPAA